MWGAQEKSGGAHHLQIASDATGTSFKIKGQGHQTD